MIVNSINKIKQIKYNQSIKCINNLNKRYTLNNRLFSTSNQNQNQQDNNNNQQDNSNQQNNNTQDNSNQNDNNNNKKIEVEYTNKNKTKSYSFSIQFGGDKESIENLFRKINHHQLGTETTKSILEDDLKAPTERPDHQRALNYFERKIKNKRDIFIEGIRSILSFMEFSSYKPIRNSTLLNPFILLLPNKINYLFNKNPFFIIMGQPSFERLYTTELYNKTFKATPPSNFNENEFLEESSEALKQIFKLAENEKSIELQNISCLPATPSLLLIRDIYYSIKHSNDLEFSLKDISIDNFGFEPISCNVYCNDFEQKYLKVESTYKVISNRYNEQLNQYPITIRANWLTEKDNIDWKIFGLTMTSEFSPI